MDMEQSANRSCQGYVVLIQSFSQDLAMSVSPATDGYISFPLIAVPPKGFRDVISVGGEQSQRKKVQLAEGNKALIPGP